MAILDNRYGGTPIDPRMGGGGIGNRSFMQGLVPNTDELQWGNGDIVNQYDLSQGGQQFGAPTQGMSTMGKLGVLSQGIQGIGGLMSGFAQLKNLGIARDQLGENKRQFGLNFAEAQRAAAGRRQLANNDITARNNFVSKGKRTGGYTLDKLIV